MPVLFFNVRAHGRLLDLLMIRPHLRSLLFASRNGESLACRSARPLWMALASLRVPSVWVALALHRPLGLLLLWLKLLAPLPLSVHPLLGLLLLRLDVLALLPWDLSRLFLVGLFCSELPLLLLGGLLCGGLLCFLLASVLIFFASLALVSCRMRKYAAMALSLDPYGRPPLDRFLALAAFAMDKRIDSSDSTQAHFQSMEPYGASAQTICPTANVPGSCTVRSGSLSSCSSIGFALSS